MVPRLGGLFHAGLPEGHEKAKGAIIREGEKLSIDRGRSYKCSPLFCLFQRKCRLEESIQRTRPRVFVLLI